MRRALLATLLLLLPTSVHAADLPHPEDASLHGVFFHDAREGWVVGDDGVIRHTIDGGKTWEPQVSGTRASLQAVFFLDESLGWVVGREERPFEGGSVGVILFTRDGGVRWQRLLDNSLSGLNAVRFTDRNTGFLLGDGTEPFTSGLFRTHDGGKSWEPVRGTRTPTWTAGDFLDGKNGILVGPWGRLSVLRNDVWMSSGDDAVAGRNLRAVKILRQRALSLGEGGQVLALAGGKTSWEPIELPLAVEARSCFDPIAIAAVDDHVWIAGRPGSVILASRDGGRSWKVQRTGQTMPLESLHFIDTKRGWAVGTGGTVLRTSDGGDTWSILAQASKRSPLLCISARNEGVLLDTIAHFGAAEGYHAAVHVVGSADPGTADGALARMSQRLQQAVRRAGGIAAEQSGRFPLPDYLTKSNKERLLAHWDPLHERQAARALLRHLVLTLRMWRPDAVVIDTAKSSAAEALVAESLVEALRLGADPQAFPEQIKSLGLETWKVRSLFGAGEGSITQDNTLLLAPLQAGAREFAESAQLHISDHPLTLPARRSFRVLAGVATPSLLVGASAAGDGTRRHVSVPEPDPRLVRQLQTGRQIVQLAEQLPRSEAVFTQLVPLLAGLPENAAAPATFNLAQRYARRGEWDLARELFVTFADRFPAHPLAVEAQRWLIRHNTSGEARRRHELNHFARARPDGTIDPTMVHAPRGLPALKPPIKQAAALEVIGEHLSPLASLNTTREWNQGALEFEKRLVGFGPLAANDTSLQFCLQAARRRLGEDGTARDWYGRFAQIVPSGPRHEAAAAETWLSGPGPKTRHVLPCRAIDRRPFLDGKLDDPCWRDQAPLVLTSVAGGTAADYPTHAWLAFDAEFLYLALRCRHPSGRSAPPIKERARDADLESHDRVALLIDIDRDYATCYHLQIDQRGCVRDDCWGDASWNPKWFVAIHSQEDAWQVEAAIPLNELTSERVSPETRWACNLVRIMPGHGIQSHSRPAGVAPRPEGMSVLLFQREAPRSSKVP